MLQAFRRIAVTLLIVLFVTPLLHAQETGDANSKSSIDVMGQVLDHNSITVPGYEIPLPRILLMNGEWYFYKSTKSAVGSGEFKMVDEGLVPVDGSEITLDLSITSHLVFVWGAILVTFLLTFLMSRKYKKGVGRETEPHGWFQNVFEITFVFVRDEIAKDNIPGDKYQKFVPFLFTTFLAISFMNLFGLLPWGATATADITVTGMLAFISFFLTQWNGSKDHWEHVFWFPNVSPLMRLILTPIEIVGLFTKPFALAVRLFANMLLGKVMIICILGLIFIFSDIFGSASGVGVSLFSVPLTVLLYILKGFICILQAYIFVLLTAVFIGMAADEPEEHEQPVEAHA